MTSLAPVGLHWFFRPWFYTSTSNETATPGNINKQYNQLKSENKEPGLLQISPATSFGIGKFVLGGILWLTGLGKDNSTLKWLGGILTVAGALLAGIGKFVYGVDLKVLENTGNPKLIEKPKPVEILDDKNNNPREKPVFMLFSRHHSKKDGQWVTAEIEEILKDIDPKTPIVIWHERAAPDNMPMGVKDLKDYLKYHGKFTLAKLDWNLLLTEEPVEDKVKEFIMSIYNECLQSQMSDDEYASHRSDAFALEISKKVSLLEKKGLNITHKIENPTFEENFNSIKESAYNRAAFEDLDAGKRHEALLKTIKMIELSLFCERQRDGNYTSRIAEQVNNQPGNLHIVIRGTYHSYFMQEECLKHKINFTKKVNPRSLGRRGSHLLIQRYSGEILSKDESPQTIKKVAKQQIIERVISAALRQKMNFDFKLSDPYGQDLFNLVLGIPEDLLSTWVYDNSIPKQISGINQLGLETLKWINRNRDKLSQQGKESLDKILQVMT